MRKILCSVLLVLLLILLICSCGEGEKMTDDEALGILDEYRADTYQTRYGDIHRR